MQVISSVLKIAKKDGKQVDLDEFVLSSDTIRRRRQENRATITENAKKEFLDNAPDRLSLHWDGKMMADLFGDLHEMEAIIVCGENYPLATLSRHLWFLAPTTVLFSLASEKLEEDDKSRIAVRLLTLSKSKEMHMGLPTFPQQLSDKTELRDLVTSESWELFDVLKLSA